MFADVLQFGGVETVGAVSTNFACNLAGDSACAGAGGSEGDFLVSSSTGVFAQYNGTFGLIHNTSNAAQPLNTLFSLPGFLTFDLNNNVTVELTFLPLGTDTPSATCAGLTHCTPESPLLITPSDPAGLSGLNLDATAPGTAVTSGVIGTVHLSDGTTAPISGNFTIQELGVAPQSALTLLLGGSAVTYQANLTSPIPTTAVTPEPSSIVMTALGSLGFAGIGGIRNRFARWCRGTANHAGKTR